MAKSCNEVRKDFLGRKVVITVVRKDRPHDEAAPQKKPKTTPPEKCYFCPGNEHLTPPEIGRIEKGGKWEVRCFPNKFPAFCQESRKAYGRHEVIVETPDHQKTLSELSVENLFDYLSMVKRRMAAAEQDPKIEYVCVFKNEGKEAGASLEHSHTQLVGMPFVPEYVKKFQKKMAKLEKLKANMGKMIYAENGGFFALCPKTSRFHFESWISSKEKAASISELDDDRLRALASVLKQALVATDAATNYAPYNIVYMNAPKGEKEFPFHIQILPRIGIWAGFELGTEVIMTSEIPEESAKVLCEKAKLAK